jgi:predicted RNA binding protein YcfA (HicA-like mRNA interferase family)
MPKRWSSKEVEKILGRNGFVLVSQKGSHKKYILGSKIVGLEITDFF